MSSDDQIRRAGETIDRFQEVLRRTRVAMDRLHRQAEQRQSEQREREAEAERAGQESRAWDRDPARSRRKR